MDLIPSFGKTAGDSSDIQAAAAAGSRRSFPLQGLTEPTDTDTYSSCIIALSRRSTVFRRIAGVVALAVLLATACGETSETRKRPPDGAPRQPHTPSVDLVIPTLDLDIEDDPETVNERIEALDAVEDVFAIRPTAVRNLEVSSDSSDEESLTRNVELISWSKGWDLSLTSGETPGEAQRKWIAEADAQPRHPDTSGVLEDMPRVLERFAAIDQASAKRYRISIGDSIGVQLPENDDANSDSDGPDFYASYTVSGFFTMDPPVPSGVTVVAASDIGWVVGIKLASGASLSEGRREIAQTLGIPESGIRAAAHSSLARISPPESQEAPRLRATAPSSRWIPRIRSSSSGKFSSKPFWNSSKSTLRGSNTL